MTVRLRAHACRPLGYEGQLYACLTLARPEVKVELDPRLPWVGRRRPARTVIHVQWIEGRLREQVVRCWLRCFRLLIALAVLRLQRVPVVWTWHNWPGKGHGRPRLDLFLRRALARLAHVVVFTTAEARDEMAELLGRPGTRLLRIAEVVPLPRTRTARRDPVHESAQELRIAEGIPAGSVLFFYGRPFGQPDLRHELAGRLPPGAKLVVIDATPTPASDERFVPIAGRPDDDRYARIVAACDAVVFPDAEALGSLTVLTAVGLGRPLLCPPAPAFRRAIELGVAVEWTPDQDLPATPPTLDEAARRRFLAEHDDRVVGEALATALERAGAL